MPTNTKPARVSKAKLWAGAIIGGLAVAFLIFDGVTKLLQTDATVKGSEQLGYPAEATPIIGILLLVCTAIYVLPKTRLLGAILLTGYLGGAIASHVRVGNGAFPIIFSAAFGALVWAALVLREPSLFSLILLRQWPGKPQTALAGIEEEQQPL